MPKVFLDKSEQDSPRPGRPPPPSVPDFVPSNDLLETIYDVIIFVDDRQVIRYVNRAVERCFGYGQWELIGQPLTILLPERDRTAHFGHVRKFARGKIPAHIMAARRTVHGQRKDGTEFPIEVNISRHQQSGETFFAAAVRDISGRMQRESENTRLSVLLQFAFENMEEGMVVYGPGETLIAYNQRFLSLWGLRPGTLRPGMTHTEIVEAVANAGQYRADSPAQAVRDRLNSFKTFFPDDHVETRDGKVLSIRRRRLPDGGFIATYRDVTDLQLAQRQIRESQAKLKAIVECAGEAIMTLDTDFRIETANSSTITMFGWSTEHLNGMSIEELIPEFGKYLDRDTQGNVSISSLVSAEMRAKKRDGNIFPIDVVVSAMPQRRTYVVMARDISEQRVLREQLAMASRLSTLGEMATGMAHELNQPLSVMRMAADNAAIRIERGMADDDYLTEALNLIGSQAEKLAKTILNLKIFARREKSDIKQLFNPSDAAAAACHLMRGQLTLAQIDVIENYPPECPSVAGIGIQFEQVIINLLTNARDAILENRGDPAMQRRDKITVEIAPGKADGTIEISVGDTGGGIPAGIMDKIFNPFFTSKEVGKGTGLGLSISYGIITKMGGMISAENHGPGARIVIVLYPETGMPTGNEGAAEQEKQ